MADITGKVWGSTATIFETPTMALHRLVINQGFQCSHHAHAHKFNGFYVERGILEIHVAKNNYNLVDVTVLKAGDHMIVKPGEYHHFVCPTPSTDNLAASYSPTIAYEAYWPELLSEDIIRQNVGGSTGISFQHDRKEP